MGDDGVRFQPQFNQHVLSYRIDDLIDQFGLPAPHHLKIDVDGLEAKVLEGARQTLKAGRIRSIIVEVNENISGHEFTEALAGFGFCLKSKHQRWTAGPFNYVFAK